MSFEIKRSDFIQSLEKGLKVIAAFDEEYREMTLTEVAKKVDLTRANARRILLTLQHLGFVKNQDGKRFSLTPRVLSLGYAYLSCLPFRELAQPFMKELAGKVNESCSISVLDGNDMVYIARVQTKRIMTISLGIGTRLPLYATSMGKALIAGMEPLESQRLINSLDLKPFTSNTIIDKTAFTGHIELIRERGWAMSDQELELGIRSIASPLKDKHGKTVAALNISGHAGRVSLDHMTRIFLPELQKTVQDIEAALSKL